MAYNSNIPQLADKLLKSQQQLIANFQAINQVFGDNHALLDLDTKGMHTVLTMQPQVGDPATSSDQVALYNKLVTAIPQLFFRPNSNQTPIQLTYGSINTNPASSQQYTFMAGPVIVYGGLLTAVTNGQLVNLSPASTLIYVGLVSANATPPQVNRMSIPTNISGSSFNIQYSTALTTPPNVYYLALGV